MCSGCLASIEQVVIQLAVLQVPPSIWFSQDSNTMGDWLDQSIADISANAWREAIEINRLAHQILNQPFTLTDHAYRATVRKGQYHHLLKTPELAARVGDGVATRFNDWKVNLTQYNSEMVVDLISQQSIAMLQYIQWPHEKRPEKNITPDVPLLHVGITLPTSVQSISYRRRISFGRTSLRPPLAYCLANLIQARKGDIVLDPCCGSGTIPIEGAANYVDAFWLGSDVNTAEIHGIAQSNFSHVALNNTDVLNADGRALPYRNNSIDIVLTDLPWGRREGSFTQIGKLYPKLLRELHRICRQPTGSRQAKPSAYLITQGRKLLRGSLSYDWCTKLWKLESEKELYIGGYIVYLFALVRLDQSDNN
ncbi:hypothetical protein BZG36_03744 [Bifiguratus adelaidae]|uniref:Ribosomal RNA large subunit methyltransferase K/L-like methyltransferase domain-containing protein n=1 Tax=Bifiguratus adelaidae TaxID=1938954 RepID=A0A261XY75_9FUNG|nr:hypothetical protein BZG36_03744 [Bifiguratus adelaidae]